MSKKRLVVIFHSAVPSGAAGITRHADLLTPIAGWDTTIVRGDVSHMGRDAFDETDAAISNDRVAFRSVWSVKYEKNDYRRILNWLSFALTSTIAALRCGKVDVVWGSSPHLWSGLAGWIVARLRRAKFVFEVRDLWPQVLIDMGAANETSLIVRLLSALERFLYKRADAVVVVVPGLRDAVIEHGCDPQKVVVVGNGSNPLPPIDPQVRATQRSERQMDGIHGVYCGAHGRANGLEFLLDAASALREDARVHFTLIGDGTEKASLIERAEALQLTNITFLDAMPKSELRQLLPLFDIGIHCLADVPLFHRGLSPNKLFDYLATGLPVVTNVGGPFRELVSEFGVVVDPGGLTEGIAELVGMTATERAELAASGRQFLEREHSISRLSKVLENTLDDIVSNAVVEG